MNVVNKTSSEGVDFNFTISPGPQGAKGDTGTTGSQGAKGDTGPQGATGLDTNGNLSINGSITATGDITAFSDRRLKSEIERIEGVSKRFQKSMGIHTSKTISAQRGAWRKK